MRLISIFVFEFRCYFFSLYKTINVYLCVREHILYVHGCALLFLQSLAWLLLQDMLVLQRNIFVYIRARWMHWRQGVIDSRGLPLSSSGRLMNQNTDSQRRDRPLSDLNTRLKGVCFPCHVVLLAGRVLTMETSML